MKPALILVLLFVCTFQVQVFAQPVAPVDPALELTETSPSCGVCELAESESFAKSAPGKLGRGVSNILLGWTNIFAQPIRAAKSDDSVWTGIGTGLSTFVVRTIQGVVELGLFWVPPSQGEPLNVCGWGDIGVTGR